MSSFRTHLGLFVRQGLALSVSGSMVLASFPAMAADARGAQPEAEAPAESGEAAEPAASETAPAQGSGTIALLRFVGDASAAGELRDVINTTLQQRGFTVAGIKRDAVEAAKKNKCQLSDDECVKKLGAYINKNAKTPFDYYGFGVVAAPGSGAKTRVVIFDIKAGNKVIDFLTTPVEGDLVMPLALGQTVAETLVRSQQPLPELSAQARAALDNPPDPDKTAEEVEEEKRKLEEANEAAKVEARQSAMDNLAVDLRRDFKSVCRTGPREDRETVGEEGKKSIQRDLRPPCKRGPIFGYWTGRTWATGVLAVGSLVGMAGFYTVSMVRRSAWQSAQDDLKKAGVSSSDPGTPVPGSLSCIGDDCYAQYAGKVSDAAFRVKKAAIYGDVFLGVTVLMSGILGLMIWQDRSAAKKYLEQEKALKISDLQIAPVFGRGFTGGAMGFRF
jgi:hypothetical protein